VVDGYFECLCLVFFFVWYYLACTSIGREVKPLVPCRIFMACKRTLQSMSEMLCWPNFLTPVSSP
jgi:hypothetical protein